MEKQNIIPRRLVRYYIPTCSACVFSKATHRQRRSNQQKHWNEYHTDTKPGYLISIDQIVSPTPYFIGHITGILNRNRYKYATLFLYHYYGLGYMYLQKTATDDETIQSKKYLESYCKKHGVAAVRSYHT